MLMPGSDKQKNIKIKSLQRYVFYFKYHDIFQLIFYNPLLVLCVLFLFRNTFWFHVCYSYSRIREVTLM